MLILLYSHGQVNIFLNGTDALIYGLLPYFLVVVLAALAEDDSISSLHDSAGLAYDSSAHFFTFLMVYMKMFFKRLPWYPVERSSLLQRIFYTCYEHHKLLVDEGIIGQRK